MQRGVRLGVDVGTVRIGVAASDPDGLMAFPVTTVQRVKGKTADAVAELAAVVAERSATQIYVGLPRKLSGAQGTSAEDARDVATQLSELTGVTVRLVDERFSTTTASASMRQAGRNAKQQRQVIDQAAAVVILESALDIERRGNLDRVTEMIPREGGDD
ncbi:Holliday junction resolvase RuvX [Demequina sp. NBRC 110051]|uniref:Holliday junction resolvase RuvX n=1 Tax=Demequina sp. NBRC 110051 TaxID=1570340 RepID=UPI001F005191|nr:Holliday junction resolvase RuvX [Demequina sp. NBRC 110051]